MEQNYVQPDNVTKAHEVPWSVGLFDCCFDLKLCCMASFCPCVLFGRIVDIVDKGKISTGVSGALYTVVANLLGCGCIYSFYYRKKMREQFHLKESPCADMCVHVFCENCAIAQEYRELQNQGFDMSLGWEGNMQKQQNTGTTFAPPQTNGMTR